MLTNIASHHTANTRIELEKPSSGNMMTINFEISRPVTPRDIGYYRGDRRSLGIGIEQITFVEAPDQISPSTFDDQ